LLQFRCVRNETQWIHWGRTRFLVRPHVPDDHGDGEWESVCIPYSVLTADAPAFVDNTASSTVPRKLRIQRLRTAAVRRIAGESRRLDTFGGVCFSAAVALKHCQSNLSLD
jgi:hypothetical protein